MVDIITRIKENELTFSKSQKKIAEYVEENLEKAAYMTAFKLSEKTGVSEAEKLGFDGYPEFQKNLLSYAKGKLTSLQRIELSYEKIGDGNVLNSVLKSDIGHIEKTLENIDKEQFEKAAHSISSANRIYITGV